VAWIHGTSTSFANSTSSIGTNLTNSFGSAAMPFMNAFKTAQQWFTRTASIGDTNEEAYLYANVLDANGYATKLTGNPTGTFNATFNGTTTMVVNSLTSGVAPWLGGTLNVAGSPTVTACPIAGCGGAGSYTISATVSSAITSVIESPTFTQLSMGVLGEVSTFASPFYPGGNGSWLFKWDGNDCAGSTCFEYHNDATLASHSCSGGTCTDVLNVSPSSGGIRVFETGTGVTAPTNIRLVQTAQYNALSSAQKTSFDSGGIFFNPDSTKYDKQFRGFRMMGWNRTITSMVTSWSQRSTVGWVFWQDGIKYNFDVPIEVQLSYCNQLHGECWINSPCIADQAYYTSEATFVLANLNSDLPVVHEACNEQWNGGSFPPALLAAQNTNGAALFTTCTALSTFQCRLDYNVYQAVTSSLIWKSIWTGGNASRLTMVMGGQFGNPGGIDLPKCQMLATADGGSSSYWTGQACSHVDADATAPYFPVGSFAGMSPLAWTADSDGGLARVYTQLISGTLIPSSNVAGNCGNGAGITCGGPVNYTLTTGLSLSVSPANGFCIAATFNQIGSTNPHIAIDSLGSLPVMGMDGVVVNAIQAQQYALCYTTATASGSVTPQWQLNAPRFPCGTSEMDCQGVLTALANTTVAQVFGIKLIGYEGGQTYNDPCANSGNTAYCGNAGHPDVLQETLQTNFNLSTQMGQAYSAWLDEQKANGMVDLYQLSDSGPWLTDGSLLGQTNYFPFNPGTYSSDTPTARQNAIYTWILANPCWWAGCTIN
jgi:hypothetical protein